ncbi:hypothetical protein DL546_007657 [Coniochaeta pulveracea]|uniref:Uncharacterized protein n=1 Tax=Coniochaeta pulveracea TaxID=177199 RepID=A0A420YFU3_9PEZI|nr:hypothetical protein DL546_007657 [Coniochaeta pulveracea]
MANPDEDLLVPKSQQEQSLSTQTVLAMESDHSASTLTPTPPIPPRSKLRPAGTTTSMSELSVETPILREAVQITVSRHPTPTPINTSSNYFSTPPLASEPGPPTLQIPYPLPPPSPTQLLTFTCSTTCNPPPKPTYLPKHNPSTVSRTREVNLLLLQSYLILKAVHSSPGSPTTLCPELPSMSSTSPDLIRALHLAEMAMQRAEEAGRPNIVAKCHQFRGYVLSKMGRCREAYGDFVRAASVRRFADDEEAEGLKHMVEHCVMMVEVGTGERVNAVGWAGETVQGDDVRAKGLVLIQEPNSGLVRHGTFGNGAGRGKVDGRTQSTKSRIKKEEDEVPVETRHGVKLDIARTQCSAHQQCKQHPRENRTNMGNVDNDYEYPNSDSAVEQSRTERTTSISTTQTFYTAQALQLSASTYQTANTHPKDSPVAIFQADEQFPTLGAWHVTDSTTCEDDFNYQASSTSPVLIHPLTPIQDFPRPFYHRDGGGHIVFPPVSAPPELRKVRGTEFEGKYWLLPDDMGE